MSRAVRQRGTKGGGEAGYALLMVIFLVATMILFAAMASPRILTEGRREREAEMVWRGKQYDRAIRLYYQQNGRFPATLEDLEKPNNAGAYYLRKPYKDPMNSVDGSWRLIYVAPGGQLIGSVNYYSLQDMAAKLGLGVGLAGTPIGGGANPLASQPGNPAAGTMGAAAPGQQSTTTPGAPGQPSQTGQTNTSTGQPGQPTQPGQDSNQSGFGTSQGFGLPASAGSLQPVDGPVFGGSIIGVGSKVKKDSLEIYQGASNYSKWEFIWNQLADTAASAQAGAAGVVGGAPGAAPPAAGTPGTGTFGIPGAAGSGMGAGTTPPPTTPPVQQNPPMQ